MATRKIKKEDRSEQLPPFNDSRKTATVTVAPPFSFERANLHYFPLKADLTQLQKFCDGYLNLAPEFCYFKPAMPFVLLMVNYYPKMGLAEGNFGWISQNEVLLTVPLEWYEPDASGQLALKGYAQFSPFAFVDKDASQIEGREVYGWPKVEGWFTSSINPWVEDPRARRKVLELSTHGFEELYRNQYDVALPLLNITQEAPPSFTIMPPEVGGPLDPTAILPRTMSEWSSLMLSTLDWAQGRLSSMMTPSGLDLAQLIADAPGLINSMVNALVGNTVNLKQLRDAEDPRTACYQAITNAVMQITRIRRGGMLGDMALLRGDYSGGYSIELNDYPSIPIIDSLGLEVVERHRDGKPVTLKPVLPFWQELDLKYLTGTNLAWRAWDGASAPWRNDRKIQVFEEDQPTPPPQYAERIAAERAPYMTEAGANFQVAEGPFNFPEASMEVLPLLASEQKLHEFINGGFTDQQLRSTPHLPPEFVPKSLMCQLPRKLGYFEPWGKFVYLVIAHFHKMASEANDFGNIQEDQVMFAIPVRFCRGEGAQKEVLSVGFISPFSYSNNSIATSTGRELSGYNTIRAGIRSGTNTWLSKEGPLSDHVPLFDVEAEMPTSLVGAQPFEWRSFLKVVEGNSIAWNDGQKWSEAASFVEKVKDDVCQMQNAQEKEGPEFDDFLGMAADLFNGLPLNQFSFKQFRDTHDPHLACYQALVQSRFVIDRVWNMQELEKRLHVNIYHSPTQPIVQSLGLEVKSTHEDENGHFDSLQPIRPFYLKVDMRTERSTNVSWRTGSDIWRPVNPSDLASPRPMATSRPVAEKLRDRPNSQYLKEDRLERLLRQNADNPDWRPFSPDAARRLVSIETPPGDERGSGRPIFTPQMVVNNMLSSEWGHDGAPRWWRKRQQQIVIDGLTEFLRRKTSRPDSAGELTAAEQQEIADAQVRLDYLKRFRIERLPDYVLRCDMAGMEETRIFHHHDRVSGEHNPQYWSPDEERRSVPQAITSEHPYE